MPTKPRIRYGERYLITVDLPTDVPGLWIGEGAPVTPIARGTGDHKGLVKCRTLPFGTTRLFTFCYADATELRPAVKWTTLSSMRKPNA